MKTTTYILLVALLFSIGFTISACLPPDIPAKNEPPRYFIQMYPPGQPQETVLARDYFLFGSACINYYTPGSKPRVVFCGTFRVTDNKR